MNPNKIPNSLIGIAGVHHVAAELSRRGLVALPTIRNTAAYDIIAATRDGKKHSNIQVKTSQAKVGFWPMPNSKKVCANRNDLYILLRWLAPEQRFEGFLLTGREAQLEVKKEEKRQRTRNPERVIFPCIHVDRRDKTSAANARRWKRRWEDWSQ